LVSEEGGTSVRNNLFPSRIVHDPLNMERDVGEQGNAIPVLLGFVVPYLSLDEKNQLPASIVAGKLGIVSEH